MLVDLSISAFSDAYAAWDQGLTLKGGDELPDTPAVNRSQYNFMVTGFNVSTVAAITACAVAIFSNSIMVLAITAICYSVRKAFEEAVLRAANDSSNIRIDCGITDKEWTVAAVLFLNTVLFANWAPSMNPENSSLNTTSQSVSENEAG